MNAITVPRSDLYADDDHVVAEWQAEDGRYRAEFQLLNVEDDDEVDRDEEAVFMALVEVGDTVEPAPSATLDDVPRGVKWGVHQFAALPVRNANNDGSDGDDGHSGLGRGVA
jgi:hypothetical protein